MTPSDQTSDRRHFRAEDRYYYSVPATNRLLKALRAIRDRDPTENVLDPQWAARIAADVLSEDVSR